MENKDLTQLIPDKANEYCELEAQNIRREDCSYCIKDFTAGAQYGLSLQKDMMIGFAEWIMKNYFEDEYQGGVWYDKNGGMATSAELATKYLDHLNQQAEK